MAPTNPGSAEAAQTLLRDIPKNGSQPVKWYKLILEMEEFRYTTGMGLARTWSFVQKEEYEAARRDFDELKDEHKRSMG